MGVLVVVLIIGTACLQISTATSDVATRAEWTAVIRDADLVVDVSSVALLDRRHKRNVAPSLSSWGGWARCNSTRCGVIGVQRRSRLCQGSSAEETCLEPLVQIRRCLPCVRSTLDTPSSWTSWGQWTDCDASCGQGTQHRNRLCLRTDRRPCSAHFREERNCRVGKTCPAWSTWHPWGACSASCGIGLKYRTKDCVVRNVNIGVDSTGGLSILRIFLSTQLEESREVVDAERCPGGRRRSAQTVRCVVATSCTARWSDWQDWSQCSSTCGMGTSYRIRTCQGAKSSSCAGRPFEYRRCFTPPCWSAWSHFSTCSGKCKGKTFGKRFRTRTCLNTTPRIPSYRQCVGVSREERPCPPAKGKSCQKWGPWGEFSACTKTCGGGLMYKTRQCYAPPCVGPDRQRKSCNINRCPKWNEWSSFSCCSVTCGQTGVRQRTRTCRRGSPGVPGCEGPSVEAEECSPGPCNATRPHVLSTTECGRRNKLGGDNGTTTKKIIGGQQSKTFGWPWHGSLQHYDCDGGSCGWKHLCGAALIAPYWFITAGHCSEDSYYRVNHENPGDNWRVVFGMNRLHEEGTPYFLSRVYVHDNYSFINVPKADVALVKLRWPVKNGPNTTPICMSGNTEPQPGERCFITGWNALEEPEGQPLLEAQVPIVPYSTCRKLGTNYTILEEQHHLCAGDPVKANTDTCYGDSGGALHCMRADGSYYLAGVTSFGFQCGEPGHVGIYARMSSYESWIWDIIESVNDCL